HHLLSRYCPPKQPRTLPPPRHTARSAEPAVLAQSETHDRRIATPCARRARDRRQIAAVGASGETSGGSGTTRGLSVTLAGCPFRRPAPAGGDRPGACLRVRDRRAR